MTAELRKIHDAAPLTEHQADLAGVLIEHLADVRAGRYRSILVIGIEDDEHATITTQWSLAPGDRNNILLGAMDVLKADMIDASARGDGEH